MAIFLSIKSHFPAFIFFRLIQYFFLISKLILQKERSYNCCGLVKINMKQYLLNYLKKNKMILIVFGALYVIASILLAFMSATIINKSELNFLFVNRLYLIFSAIFLMVATVTFSYFANSTHFFKNKENDGSQLDEEKRNKHNNLFMFFLP